MTTKIPVELSSTPGIVDGSNATAITIDSSENVGIGTTSPNDKLHIKIGTNLNWQFGYPNSSVTTLAALNDAESAYVEGRIDASSLILNSQSGGNVGIGTASPATNLHVDGVSNYNGLEVKGAGGSRPMIQWSNANNGDLCAIYGTEGNDMVLTSGSSNTERMRLDSEGALRINNTSTIGSNDEGVLHLLGKSAHTVCKMKVTSNSQRYIHFFDASNNDAGEIQNGGGASTIYATSSDYRMKENIRPMENGLDRVAQLNPVKFTWKHYGVEQEGFIAHEAQEVFPEAVTGEKDGIDKYGKPQMQAMDYGKITPLLVKAIQEQQTIIDDLKARITTLEGE